MSEERDEDRDEDSCCPKCTRCDGDTADNVWIERDDPKATGVCLLDTLSDAQIIYILERDEKARADLLKVTKDCHLIHLANTTPRLATGEFADTLQSQINKNADTIPFYSVFRGQPPYNG